MCQIVGGFRRNSSPGVFDRYASKTKPSALSKKPAEDFPIFR
jgi:hypothetical protein